MTADVGPAPHPLVGLGTDVLAVADRSGRVRYVSPSVEQLLGYTPSEYSRLGWLELVHPDDTAVAVEARSAVRSRYRAEARCEIRLQHRDGSWRWVQVTGTNLLDDPEVGGVITSIRDVSGKRAVEQAVHASEERYRALARHGSDAVLVTDPSGLITWAGPSLERLTGSPPEAWAGTVWFDGVHPDEQALAVETLTSAVLGRSPAVAEIRLRHAEQSWRWVECTVANMLDDPNIGGMVVNLRDVTERRQAGDDLRDTEERFRVLVSQSSDIVFISDRDGRVTFVSPSIRAVLGYDPEEVLGRPEADLVHPDDRPHQLAAAAEVRSQPGLTFRAEIRVRHTDGSWRWVEVSGVNLLDNPAVAGVVVTARDVTERRHAEDALRASEERWRALLAHAADAVVVHDAEDRVIDASESVSSVLGIDRSELAVEGLVARAHPDDVDAFRAVAAAARADPGRPVPFLVRGRHGDGTWRWLEGTVTSLVDNPAVRGVVTNVRDVTERRHAEEALRASEDRFRAFAQNASDTMLIVDGDLVITYATGSVEEVFGHRPADLVGRPGLELVHPDDREKTANAVTGTGDRPMTGELRVRHAAGGWRWVEVTARDLRANPNVGGYVVNLRDVTSRRVAEEAVRASEARFRALVQNASDPVLIFDETGRVTWASPAGESLFGLGTSDMIGRTPLDLVHPDDAGAVLDGLAHAVARPDEVVLLKGRVQRPDGTVRWVEATASNLLEDPYVGGVVGNFRDVTERVAVEEAMRASEERFRALVQNSSDIVAVMDADGTVTYISPGITSVLGWEPDQALGRPAYQLGHPDDEATSRAKFERALANPGEVVVGEGRAMHRDGSWRWLEATLQNRLDDPAVAGVVGNFRDITERRRAEAALRASEERFRSLVQHSHDVVQIMGADGRISWVSPAVRNLLGVEPAAMVGTYPIDGTHPEDRRAALDVFRSVRDRPGASQRIETRLRHADGSWRWVDSIVTNRLDDPGIRGVVANYRDITDRKAAEHALQESEELFRSLAASSPTGIFRLDPAGGCTYVNERWQEITGCRFDEVEGDAWRSLVHPEDRERLEAALATALSASTALSEQFRLDTRDGMRWVRVHTEPVLDDGDEPAGHVGNMEDITAEVAAKRDMSRLTDILEATSDLVGVSDREGRLLYLNAAARRFFGIAPDAGFEGLDLRERVPSWALDVFAREAVPALRTNGIWSGELAVMRGEETVPVSALFLVHRDADGRIEFVSSVTRDISERKAFEARLEHQATHDPLTGLPNRTLLLDRLEMALARAKRLGSAVAVLFLDLDHFKVVNDSLGHGLGDRLLVAISRRLQGTLRPGDTVARFGGDEFVILCEEIDREEDAVAIAERVDRVVSGPFVVDDAEVFVTVSVGIAFSTPPGSGGRGAPPSDPEALIRDADAAMYRAKARGRARYEVFDAAMRERAVERLDIEGALRRALDRHELRLYFQPAVSVGDGRVWGFEALLRWEHPERGILLPGEFLAVAEETGLIVPIGDWVLHQACSQAARWHEDHPDRPLTVAVNLSSRQLTHPSLVDDVRGVLALTGLDPSTVVLEITESALMDDVSATEAALRALKGLGVRLAVDDFGTGYSSLSYLRRFPVDVLKVDRVFVAGLGQNPEDSAIVTAVITLAHTLGLSAVAEGVETPGQLAELRHLHCDYAQGFHLARPVPAAAVDELLATFPRRLAP
ncbi:MAG TPA: PAS domain S-box protein [Acidimicrobiales bacterium]